MTCLLQTIFAVFLSRCCLSGVSHRLVTALEADLDWVQQQMRPEQAAQQHWHFRWRYSQVTPAKGGTSARAACCAAPMPPNPWQAPSFLHPASEDFNGRKVLQVAYIKPAA